MDSPSRRTLLQLVIATWCGIVPGWLSGQDGEPIRLRVATYNIKHGEGNDGRVDLDRTARRLTALQADVIGLQEVDLGAKRSGRVDQPARLGEGLEMESAFGAFMDFQGGQYGLAILSRYPIEAREVIRLPDGNEPRVALACRLKLPGDRRIVVVNIHLDWVRDDGFRFAQAEKVAAYLESLDHPWILLGDFNDRLGSRTLERLSRNTLPANKPEQDRHTFSSTDPRQEIDFLFAAPRDRWRCRFAEVVDDPITSDHRPVLAEWELVPKPAGK